MDALSDQDRDRVARTLLSEGGNQGDDGMAAIASVIKNRVDSGRYGDSASDVVLAPNQFSAWSLPKTDPNNPSQWSPKSPQYQHALALTDDVFSGNVPDPTSGATHYLNPTLVSKQPTWAQGQPTAQIGAHSFYAPEGRVMPNDDLLGSWNSGTQQSAPSDDLLGQWQAAPSVPPGRSPIQITIHPQNYTAPGQEGPGQEVNRLLAEHQGDSFSDMATRLGLGVVRGTGDVADTLAQGITAAGTGGANLLERGGIISPQTNATVQNWGNTVNAGIVADRSRFDALAANSPVTQAGRIGGQVLGTGPLLGAGGAAIEGATGLGTALAARPVIGAALTGAGAGAGAAGLTSAVSDQPIADQLLGGAGAGLALGPIGYGASKVGAGLRNMALGTVSPETAALAQSARNQFGIPVTAGQISSNPMSRFADSVLQRLPFTGYGARTAEQQTSLNQAVANEMGVTADKITPQVIKNAKQTAYADYDAAKTNMGTLNVDTKFGDDLKNIYDNAHYTLEDPLANKVDNHLRNVISKIDPQARTLDPDLYQSLTRKNGPLDTAINSRDSKISGAASDIKDALEGLVGRNDPVLKDLKDKADYKYFVAKSLEPMAEESPIGDVSPAKLLRAVDNSQTPVGQLGRIARRFMVEPPSSGTAERLLALKIGGGLVGAAGLGGAAYEFDPDHFQRDALVGAGAFLGGRGLSSALRSGWLANSMIRSGLPRAAQTYPLANLLSRAAPAAALTYRGANGLPGQ